MSTPEFSTTSRLDNPEDLIPKEKNWPKRGKKKKKKRDCYRMLCFLAGSEERRKVELGNKQDQGTNDG